MKNLALKIGLPCLSALALVNGAKADTFTDNFNTSKNYLSTGVAVSIWDGIYSAPGDFRGFTMGNAAGVVPTADANTTSNHVLTVVSTQTDWEGFAAASADD